MTSDKRDFSDFTKFPGQITSRKWYEFPKLYKNDTTGHVRVWNIYVRLIKQPDELITDDEWDLLEENEVPVKKAYLTGEIPEGTIAEYWVETGVSDGAIMRKAPTYVEGVLAGKANERNALQEALVKARGFYLKQVSNGSKTKDQFYRDGSEDDEKPRRFFPMLARVYTKRKTIKFPCLVQPKLDGLRCVMYLDESKKKVIMYSRNLKEISGFNDLRDEVFDVLKSFYDDSADESLYLDGEIYKHGLHLQDISGIVRRMKSKPEEKKKLKYHVFDCFYPSQLDTPYKDRLMILKNFFAKLQDPKYITQVPTYIARNWDEEEKLSRSFLKKKYEGSVVKNSKGKYRADPSKSASWLRGPDVIKHKPRKSDEFEVVDFTSGTKGTNTDAIVWILQTDEGETFHATPNIKLTERKKLFRQAKKDFNKLFKGRLMTVEYDDKSKKGIPLRAKAITFRDE